MILRLRRKIADRHCWKSSQQSLSWEGWLLNQESKQLLPLSIAKRDLHSFRPGIKFARIYPIIANRGRIAI